MSLQTLFVKVSSASKPAANGCAGGDQCIDLCGTESLTDLVELTGAPTDHEAYFRAKREWAKVCQPERQATQSEVIPGNVVEIDGVAFHVHGVTHAGTDAEEDFLVRHVSDLLADGASVFCEQGIRRMYFEDMAVEEMDDYQWATARLSELDDSMDVDAPAVPQFGDLGEGIDALRSRIQQRIFSLVESTGDLWGDDVQATLGALASECLTSHEDAATGTDFDAYRKSQAAARDPDRLVDLQNHYWRAFLPPPVEREWLRRHDPRLEIVTHARNERMADYAVYHNTGAENVHMVVGAAHQPGIVYYLERHRDGGRSVEDFDLL
jgi:hypothetical protein